MLYAVRLFRFPIIDYRRAYLWQAETASAVGSGGPEALALLQHLPVYTLGRRARREHLLRSEEALRSRGAAVIETDRGGSVTFHGPGQLVLYPVLDLRRRRLGPIDYVRRLEEAAVRALDVFGLRGERLPGRPGVWVAGAKVAAVGVRVQGGIATHGLALNVETDLSWFDAIVPCGLAEARVTSLAQLLGASPGLAAAEDALLAAFQDVFESDLLPAPAPLAAHHASPMPATVVAHGR